MIDEQNQPEGEEIIDLPEVGEDEEDTTDWKALALKNQGIAKRLKTKLEKSKEEKPEKPQEPAKPDKPNDEEFTSGDKALLKSYYDIKGADELAFAKSWMKRTGDDIDNLGNDDLFKSRLQGLRDAKAAKDALPMNPKRGVQTSPKDSPEYWIDKPFEDVPENLKRSVLNLKIHQEKESDKFGGKKG